MAQAAWKTIKAKASDAKEIVEEVVFNVKTELDEFVITGLGIPKAVSSAVSFGCFAIAGAGTVSISLDLFKKVYGTKECKGCNGWEGLTCQTCKGNGKVYFRIKNPNLKPGEASTAENLATAVADGRADVAHIPFGLNFGEVLPTKECPTCTGSGVMKCPTCNGNAFKGKITLDRLFDTSSKAWDVYRLARPVQAPLEVVTNPDLARYHMFVRPEMEHGEKIPEETKQRMWWQYQYNMQYYKLRSEIAERGPGWEEKQKALVQLNPSLALRDPVLIYDIPFFKAAQESEKEVLTLPVPPRPADWGSIPDILSEPDWSKVSDPKQKEEWRDALQKQEEVKRVVLEEQWARHWRQGKVEEVLRDRTTRKVLEPAQPAPGPVENTEASKPAAKEAPKTTGKKKTDGKKKSDKKADEERKRKEKDEKRAKLAKQAAEREATLAAAKK